jgi:hypothetical protein
MKSSTLLISTSCVESQDVEMWQMFQFMTKFPFYAQSMRLFRAESATKPAGAAAASPPKGRAKRRHFFRAGCRKRNRRFVSPATAQSPACSHPLLGSRADIPRIQVRRQE